MKTHLLSASLWVAAAGLLAGAFVWIARTAPTQGAVSTDAVQTLPTPQMPGTLTVWSWNIAAKSLQRLVPEFNQAYPNIRVNVDMTGARMQARLMLSLASGVGAPDVSQFELSDAPRYIATGRLADLTPLAAKYRDQFPASLWDNCTLDGKVYAIPWDMGPCAVYYKRDIFARCGINPEKIETWDDYIEAGKVILQKTGGRTKMLPLGSNSLRSMFELLIQQNGGQVFDAEGRLAINTPQAREVLATIQRMRESGICSDVAAWGQEFMAGFNDDTIATYPNAVWFAGTIKDSSKDFAGKKPDWGVFKLPALKRGGLRVANLGGSVLVVPAQGTNKEAAWAFVEYALCTRAGQISQYRSMSLFPAFLPALEDPFLDEPDPFFGGQAVGRLFATDVTKITRLNRTPQWGEASRYLDQEFSHWAADGMRSEGLFEKMEQKMARRLGVAISPQSLSRQAQAKP